MIEGRAGDDLIIATMAGTMTSVAHCMYRKSEIWFNLLGYSEPLGTGGGAVVLRPTSR
jgi:hypothetical protein